MIDQNLVEFLQNNEWFVQCENIEQFEKLLFICEVASIEWCSSNKNQTYNDIFRTGFPVYIGVDNEYCPQKLCYTYKINFNNVPPVKNISQIIFSLQCDINELKNNSWFVECKDSLELECVLNECGKLGLIEEDEEYLNNKYPIHIGVDKTSDKDYLIYTLDDFNFENKFYNKSLIPNITTWFFTYFKKQLNILLLKKAINSNIEIEIKDKNGKWFKSDLSEIKIISKTPLNITSEMWEMIDKAFNYAAMDIDKNIWFYDKKPVKNLIGWQYIGTCRKNLLLSIDTTNINWDTSLCKRPKKE